MRAFLLLVAATALLAGCLDGQIGVIDEGDIVFPAWTPPHTYVPMEDIKRVTRDPLAGDTDIGHAHTNAEQHHDQENVETLAHVPGEQGQGFSELDIIGDYAYQCSGGGFRILDITNRSAPVVMGQYTSNRNCADVKVTQDGAFAIVMGREIVDVRDKTNPTMVNDATGTSCHMCYIKEIEGKEYVFLARAKPHEIPFGSGIGIYEFVREPPSLVHVSDFIVAPEDRINTHLPDGDSFAHQVHDMMVYDDPIVGKTVMLAAYWDLGVRVVDVSNPKQPMEIGAWDDFNGDLGDIHTVGVDVIDGRRYIAAGTENGAIIDPAGSASGYSVGYVYLLDATNFADIITLGKWLNPGKDASGRESVGVYSMHNLQFLHGRIYAAHYHAGVWLIDAEGYVKAARADPARTALKNDNIPTLGFYFTSSPGGTGLTPNVWDVVLKDGYLYASDIGNGLHVLHFFADPLGDTSYTSIG